MYIPRGRRHGVNKKILFCLFFFIFFLVCFMVLWVMFIIFSLLFSLHHVCVGHAYILMLLFFIDCMFGLSFALLYNHCSHFFMIVLVYSQVTHMFYIMFTWSQFTCYIILVLLLLAFSWESNVFCASVSEYKYICSKCIIAPRFRCEWVLPLFPNSHLSLEYVLECFVTQ